MALRKYVPKVSATPPVGVQSLNISIKENGKVTVLQKAPTEADVDLDLREVYFLVMHFLSSGPCQRTCGQLWDELLEHQLLPRRYHAWYSRSGLPSGDENDDGISLPLNYSKLVERHPHVDKDHLVKLLKQLILASAIPSRSMVSGNMLNAASVPTLLGVGSFSFLSSDHSLRGNKDIKSPSYMRWPHRLADQIRSLGLREIGGGFIRHHRAPSTHAACYAIAKPSTMVQKMQNTKCVRGHRNAVYCAIFDRSGRYVVTGSDDRLVKIWSMETAYCLASCRGHEGDITDLAVSFNNALVASASNDCMIRIWRMPDGLPISVLRGHSAAVTAIAFSPRPGALYQLLSSSDDGTCRIWDARYSQFSPRIYVPKPSDSAAGRSGIPSSSNAQQSHQIFCCAFNASGTVFVTGSSDTLARVWNACKPNTEDSEQPNHEIDVLAGHENDVNYVQFSGCAVAARAYPSDGSKEETLPKFRNTWLNHDNIVTCSRDGSAIIWIPRSRRSHGKTGRWIRAYHLKVPPPPLPPQPPRGGPRQRYLPTPRGVNMIAWSLDNRFVLAAIMDCRICVWNAVDGSLVHSLTGHTNSTYVLDVHPFNPRIAMSAGYDGKTIVWDIWEGAPIRTYEIGPFKLVDGKFSPDGTSIILSDDVGQLYILSTGQGESQRDAKFDQFFLGDYRPLIHDTHGNVLDQETQLAPYRRNMQDLLCDSGMIPYSEPYQSMYQKRRLGALGIEWRLSSLRLAVGVDFSLDPDFQMVPIVDLDALIEPMPEFADVMDWEPDEIFSDDNDSEYHVTEDYSSGGDHVSLNSELDEPECSYGDSEMEESQRESRHRSKKRKQKVQVELMTSSGRRVKRKNLDGFHDSSNRNNHSRKLQNGRKALRKRSPSRSRPRRAAARNALHLFSRITGTSAEGDVELSDASSSESGSTLPDSGFASEESDVSLPKEWYENCKGKEIARDFSVGLEQTDDFPKSSSSAPGKNKIILRLPNRDTSKQTSGLRIDESQPFAAESSSRTPYNLIGSDEFSGYRESSVGGDADDKERSKLEARMLVRHLDLLGRSKDGSVTWGGVRARTSKKLKVGECSLAVSVPESSSVLDQNLCAEDVVNGLPAIENANGVISPLQPGIPKMESTSEDMIDASLPAKPETAEDVEICAEVLDGNGDNDESSKPVQVVPNGASMPLLPCNGSVENNFKPRENGKGIRTKLRIKCSNISRDQDGSSRPVSESPMKDALESVGMPEKPDGMDNACIENQETDHLPNGAESGYTLEDSVVGSTENKFKAVYRRLRPSRSSNPEAASENMEEAGPSNVDKNDPGEEVEAHFQGIRRARSIRFRSSARDLGSNTSDSPVGPSLDAGNEDWPSGSKNSTRLRSARIKKGTNYVRDVSPPRKSTQSVKRSWLMLSHHEEGSRYIPQRGDEVVYLRQGHQEYLSCTNSRTCGPWETVVGNIRAVEFCRLEHLEYSTLPGSGDSCCKMTLRFSDPDSDVSGKAFKLTLPEVTSFPDFLVEKSRYDASISRNWTARDKCKVWWRNEGDDDGSWWDGRILQVKPKTVEFPGSPWERYVVKYRSDPTETHHHSPWELHNTEDTHWEQPRIDDDTREKLLAALSKLEESGRRARDYYGVGKLKDITQKANFINRFPVPLSLQLIRDRLANSYYRGLDAMKHDVEVMLSNAEAYIGGKNGDQDLKMSRLSDWFTKTLL